MKSVFAAIATLGAFVVGVPAIAQKPVVGIPVDPGKQHHRAHLEARGQGRIDVKGSGYIHVHGQGQVVVIAASREQIKVEGFGVKSSEGNRFVFEGSGRIQVHGKEIAVMAEGKIEHLGAGGTGTAMLAGRGHFHTKMNKGVWNTGGVSVSYP